MELHFSLVAAVFAYTLWQSTNVTFQIKTTSSSEPPITSEIKARGYCHGTSKGLFLGLMSTIATIIVLIMYSYLKVGIQVLIINNNSSNNLVDCRMAKISIPNSFGSALERS